MAVSTFAELKTAIANEASRSDLTSRIPEFVRRAEDRIAQRLRISNMEASASLVLTLPYEISASQLGGTANALTITNTTTKSSNTLGDSYTFTAEATNTSTVTLNVDGIGLIAIKKGDGGTALEASDIVIGGAYTVYFDGTLFRLTQPGAVPLPSRFLENRRIMLPGSPATIMAYVDPVTYWSTYLAGSAGKPIAYTIEGDYILFGPTPDGTYYPRILYYRRFATLSSDSDTNWLIDNAGHVILDASMVELFTHTKEAGKVTLYAARFDAGIEEVMERDRKAKFSGSPLQVRSDVFGG